MDEPSAVLAHDEVDNLFRVIRDLTAAGVAVVYISHRLEEIRTIGDRVTVLKDGRTVATGLPARTTPDPGRRVADDRPHDRVRVPAAAGTTPAEGDELLRVENLALAGSFRDVELQRCARARSSASPAWSAPGRSEVLETVYGARRRTSGTVTVDGQEPAGGQRLGSGRAPASAWPPRSARARRCCWASRSCATSRSPRCAGSPGSAG